MGEYYMIVNSDKGQYLDSNSLGMSVKLDGLIASPLPAILVWLLADGVAEYRKVGDAWLLGRRPDYRGRR